MAKVNFNCNGWLVTTLLVILKLTVWTTVSWWWILILIWLPIAFILIAIPILILKDKIK